MQVKNRIRLIFLKDHTGYFKTEMEGARVEAERTQIPGKLKHLPTIW